MVSERGCLGLEQGRLRSFRELLVKAVSLEHTIYWDPEPWSMGELPGCPQKPSVTHEAGAVSVALGRR